MLSFPLASIIFGISILAFDNKLMKFAKTNIYHYICLGIIFGIGFIILSLANLKKKIKKDA